VSRTTAAKTIRLSIVLTIAAAVLVAVTVPDRVSRAAATGDPVIGAAGDISCGAGSTGASCKQSATSDLLLQMNPAAVLTLGDNQYEQGAYSDFTGYYDPSWGRLRALTHPVVGNHDYLTTNAQGFFDYWNGVGNFSGPGGDRNKGYYSYDVGAWHLIVLNSECSHAGGCGSGSPQEMWLKADLAAHPTACTLAYTHHPRWASDYHNFDDADIAPFYQDLYNANAEILMVGHSHFYERFAPQNPSEQLDNARGIREFIVGTGGRNVYGNFVVKPNSEVRNGSTFGVLKLTLHPTSYDWQFVPISGQSFTDSGSTACHGGGPGTTDTAAPTVPTNLTGSAIDSTHVNLSWTPSTDNVGVAGYRIIRNGSAIASSSAASYTDATASPATSYQYQVAAFDAAGNVSAASTAVNVTTPSAGSTLVFLPTDDAYVEQGLPTSNFGGATSIRVDNSPVRQSLLKYAVTGVGTRTVVSAKLRLYCTNPSGFGGDFRTTTSGWSEGTVTWNTAPAAGATSLATLGSVTSGVWYEVNVTGAVAADGTVSFRVVSPSTDGAWYSSKEGTSGFAPQLVVSVA